MQFSCSIEATRAQINNLKQNIMKATFIIIVIISLITVGLYYSPKGNNYIQWEKDMIKIGQIKN